MGSHSHEIELDPRKIELAKDSGWRRVPAIAGVIGVAALGAAFALKGDHDHEFYYAYLTAFMTFLAFGLGGLIFVMLQHITRAGWSVVVRRLAENVALTLIPMAVLSIPIWTTGMESLFHWAEPHALDHDPVLAAKASYLNPASFQTRAIGYLAIWAGLAWFYYSTSRKMDTTRDWNLSIPMWRVSAPGIVLFAMSLTFAAFDWLMSLDPHWFSTIFGVYYFAGAFAGIHALLAVLVITLHRSGYLKPYVNAEHFHDLGKFMFAFTVFWAYAGFSQYMLYWYASIPEETEWFAYRGVGQWLTLSLVLVFWKFVLPFLGLLARTIKRNPSTLYFWGVWILIGQYIDMYWLIQPVLAHHEHREVIHFGLVDVLTLVGIGGVFLASLTWALGRAPLVPVGDPRLQESLHHENF